MQFTYALPASLGKAERGMRVLVPFGKRRMIGVVADSHETLPKQFFADVSSIKSVIQILDTSPIVTSSQFSLWNWISEYYISPIGDVMKAALPTGLKSQEGYKPRTELCVDLPDEYSNPTAIHDILDTLERARASQQLKLMSTFLELSGWDGSMQPLAITRDELMNASHANISIFRTLVQRGYLATFERVVGRLNNAGEAHLELMNPLNPHQQKAYDEIIAEKHPTVLLHGVTSSGKTEIYIHLIAEQLRQGKQVLYMLPEIALTIQIMQRLQRIFGNRLGIYHSKYSDAERVEIWEKQLSNTPYDIILGARSSVFLPFKNLGLVIVDEEHETSYKQQDPAPRYNGKNTALMLAQMFGAKTILGTATPSLETYYNAQKGKYGIVSLTHRYKDIKLPEIKVVDIHDLQRRKMMKGLFSPLLTDSIHEALQNGEQVILFQNRRGFSPIMECKQCGWVPKCSNCDVSLTYHKSMNQLTCHYCGFSYKVPEVCPECGNHVITSKGFGTEKVEDIVREMFPEARVARMDMDTTKTRSAYERMIDDFASGKTNLLIGTQMISKGLDFDKVSVVGILNANSMLSYPDFRAYEHAYMMMAQVSGRAGRKGKQGLVILQTKTPDAPLIRYVANNDYSAFYNAVLAERKQFHYPPFIRVINIYLRHANASVVQSAGIELSSLLRQKLGNRVLGPDRPPIARIKTMHIRKLLIKTEPSVPLATIRQTLLQAQEQLLKDHQYTSLQIYYDVDPL